MPNGRFKRGKLMSELYENLLRATDNTKDITNEKYATITKIENNLCNVNEDDSSLEHENVPILNGLTIKTGDKVVLGFVANSIYNPIILGKVGKAELDSEQIVEKSGLNNLGLAANSTQHQINLKVNEKINQGGGSGVDIVTSWNSTPTDTSVPSEKLTKDTLDLKLNSSDAFSGDYDDLTNKPTIPSKITDLTNDSDFIEKSSTNGLVKNDGTIDTTNYSTFDGNYNSLTNKPTIPSKTSDLTNDGDGTNVFVKNNDSRLSDARTPTTHTHTKSDINDFPTIPSKLSDLTNDSDFIEKSNTSGLIKNDGTVDTTQYLSSLPSHNHDGRYYTESEVDTALGGKQATLVSGTNIKTINNQSLLGSGNITIQGGGGASNIFDLDPTSQYGDTVVEEGVDKDGTGLGYGNDILIYNSQESRFYYDKNGNADYDEGNELATMNDIPTPYRYDLTSTTYNPTIDTSFTISCKVTNSFGNNVSGKSITLYKDGTSVSSATTNSSGVATWTVTLADWDNHHFNVENASLELKANGWKTLLDSGGYLIKTKDNRVQFSLNVASVSFPTSFTAFGGGAKVPTGYRPNASVVVPCKSNYPLFVAILPDGTVERRTFNSSQQTAGAYAFAEWTI